MPLLLTLLLLSASFAAVNAAAYGGNCNSTTCGNVEIRYPFYQISSTYSASTPNSYCGYYGLALSCSDQTPILTLPSNNYTVKYIDYVSHAVTLVDNDVVSGASLANNDCPRVYHNLTIGIHPLKPNRRNADLAFYFNCSGVDESPITPIGCLNETVDYEARRSYVFEAGMEPPDVEWWRVCEEKVLAVVEKEKVNWVNLVEGYAEAMRSGFVLDWGMKERECAECEKSGGLCGYRPTAFVCFCKDGGVAGLKCKRRLDLKTKLIIGFSVCGGTALIVCAIFFICQRRKKANYAPSSYFTRNVSSDLSSINDPEKMGALYGVKFFTFDELEEATDSFNDKRELGDGGFGTVYLGKLKDGRTVAVKRLYENNYKRVEQFLNEVEILTRLRHKNLVMLYGCTSRHSRELLLVYEYVSNGTVADHVHGRDAKSGLPPWETRLKIAVETASALKYLHASDIIHRDVKTNNILLDDNFSVKVADFGLSRLFPLDVTHVSTAPQGTPGYVDPEYHQCYQLTDKSDVYSFGVVLVELISSKPAVDITRHRHEINLSNMAINKIQNGTLQELVDPSLGFEKDCNVQKSITAVAELAFQCLQSDKDMRPTMQEVLEILTRIQCGDSRIDDNAEELDIFSDEFVLLKSGPLPLSPDSVTVKWVSGSAASNSSG